MLQRKALPLSLGTLGLFALGALSSAALAARGPERPQEEEEHEETELDQDMEVIEEAVKQLRRSLRDPEAVARSLELVDELQAAAVAAKSRVPSMAANVPEAERATFVADYRRAMIDFVVAQLELERALLDGDAEAAKEALGRVRDMEDSGHERFTEDEE